MLRGDHSTPDGDSHLQDGHILASSQSANGATIRIVWDAMHSKAHGEVLPADGATMGYWLPLERPIASESDACAFRRHRDSWHLTVQEGGSHVRVSVKLMGGGCNNQPLPDSTSTSPNITQPSRTQAPASVPILTAQPPADKVSFWLNGDKVTLDNPDPTLLLLDYLRSPQVGLAGPKKGCGQGGCGACACILSEYDTAKQEPVHTAINSCLRPVCSLDGLVVTTVEGTGGKPQKLPAKIGQSLLYSRTASRPGAITADTVVAHAEAQQVLEDHKEACCHHLTETTSHLATTQSTKTRRRRVKLMTPSSTGENDKAANQELEAINPVARRLAENNGSQCGYCSTGMVMNMTGYLQATPAPAQQDIEDLFDGNICRCTGYRPILTAMKTFASDWTAEDEKNRMKCVVEPDRVLPDPDRPYAPTIPFPEAAKMTTPRAVALGGSTSWITIQSVDVLSKYMSAVGDPKAKHFVHANTSFGIYPEEFTGQIGTKHSIVNIGMIPGLNYSNSVNPSAFQVGAGVTYTHLIDKVKSMSISVDDVTPMGAILYMARRTAGTIVRNAATLGGNTMLVLKHIKDGEPFPSDLFTVFYALDVEIEYYDLSTNDAKLVTTTAPKLVETTKNQPDLPWHILIKGYTIPLSSKMFIMPNKTAKRDINSHSIINSAVVITMNGGDIATIKIVFGGIAPYPWRASDAEARLTGMPLQNARAKFADLISAILKKEVMDELVHNDARMADVPSEGVTHDFKCQLAAGFVYKALVRAQTQQREIVPVQERSAGDTKWGSWGVSSGRQYPDAPKVQEFTPLRVPYIKLAALNQTTGNVRYTHEMSVPRNTLNGAFIQSERAVKTFSFDPPVHPANPKATSLAQRLAADLGFTVHVVDKNDVPLGGKNFQGMGSDQPLFADGTVHYIGQALAMVLAETEEQAIVAAKYARRFVRYSPTMYASPWNEPILTVGEARAIGAIYPDFSVRYPSKTHLWKLTRPASSFDWAKDSEGRVFGAILDGVHCQVVRSKVRTGRQIHFYMETQAAVAIPLEDNRMMASPSSQSPAECHQTCADALAVEANRVEIEIRQLGGSFGGKTEQSRFIVGPAVVAARALERPVRIAMEREADSAMLGHRAGIEGESWIAIDENGLVHGLRAEMYLDGGAFLDCSFIVANVIQLRSDNAYYVKNFETQVDVVRTNTQPTTAFRGFGDIQSMLLMETAWDDAVVVFNSSKKDRRDRVDPLDIRFRNLYQRGQITPYGQGIPYCYMDKVLEFTRTKSKYDEKRIAAVMFNAENKWHKRGVYMVPIKYGAGFHHKMLEQATCLVSVYHSDGTVIINQSGVDMGQGLTTKLLQVAAHVLNVPMSKIHIQQPKTSVVPNPSSTESSIGTSYNGEAVRRACQELRGRLLNFGYSLRDERGETWCNANKVDFWNHPEGWSFQPLVPDGKDTMVPGPMIWFYLVQQAFGERLNLTVSFNAKIHGGEEQLPVGTFKTREEQPDIPDYPVLDYDSKPFSYPANPSTPNKFVGFTYSAACSEVEVDVLTGEVKIISSTLVFDTGLSINPALDVGQIEGAFIMGIGYVLLEKVAFEDRDKTRPDYGKISTVNTWRYKPPAITTVPLNLDVYMYPEASTDTDLPENPNDFFSSKEIGEPPLILATTVFLAVKDAVRAYREETNQDTLFELNAPATVQEVQRACGQTV
jgi:xanthine dehydrogenase/oxidase